MKRREQLTQKDKIKIISLYNGGMPVYKIQNRYNLKSAESVYRIIRMTPNELVDLGVEN